jgi:uncharacterized membrane protein
MSAPECLLGTSKASACGVCASRLNHGVFVFILFFGVLVVVVVFLVFLAGYDHTRQINECMALAHVSRGE